MMSAKIQEADKMEKLKILVVDDESRMRKLVSDFLTRQDYEVLEAEDEGGGSGSFLPGEKYCTDHFGCNDAQDGRMAGLPGDPQIFQGSDHYADSPGR